MRGALRRLAGNDAMLTMLVGVVSIVSSLFAFGTFPRSGAQSLLPFGLPLLLTAVVPLLWRSKAPIPVALVSVTASTFYYSMGFPGGAVIIAGALALYTVVASGHRWVGWCIGLGQFLLVHFWEAMAYGAPSLAMAIGMLAWVLDVLVVGEVMRKRREYQEATGQREEARERTREEESLRRIADERLRLAQEVHDVVAHNISLINVQAGTALYLMEAEPTRAADALATIKDTSKETLRELRSTLGVMRSADEGVPRSPAPSLSQIGPLITKTRAAGIGIACEVRGAERAVPASVDTTAYRVVQEALTNAVRHAEPHSIAVRIDYRQAALRIEVADDGTGPPQDYREGNGITGMRERVFASGGELRVEPGAASGFRIWAHLPIAEAVGEAESGST